MPERIRAHLDIRGILAVFRAGIPLLEGGQAKIMTSDLNKLRDEFRHERRHGDTHKAYLLIQGILDSGHAELSDFFSAAECAVRLSLFADVIGYTSRTIDLSKHSGEEYYLDQAYFWRAYAHFKIKNFTSAIADLDSIKRTNVPFYIYSVIPGKEVAAYSIDELASVIRAAATSDGI